MGTKKEQATNIREEGQGGLPGEWSSPETRVLKDEKDGTSERMPEVCGKFGVAGPRG